MRLIEKNTTLPTRRSQVFSTAEDNQPAVSIHVLQGEWEMAAGNKTLGRFELIGIAPAPRGLPQIEVSFDIDANGIVEVSAKDQATGKQQSIKITASSGLTKEEIDSLIQDATLHAEEDRKKKELAEARNAGDGLIYTTEKTIVQVGDKIDAGMRAEVDNAIKDLKRAMEGEDISEIKRQTEVLTHASHSLASTLYQQQGAAGGCAGGSCGKKGADRQTEADDIVDADFREVA